MDQEEFDEEMLRIAVDRRGALSTLAGEPLRRGELQDELDISKTTCHRIIRQFEKRGLIRRTGDEYELTKKGELVEEHVDNYYEKMRLTSQLEPLVAAFDSTDVGFDIELFTDARITRPDPNNPTLPINREFELFEQAETFRTLDGNQYIPSMSLEQMFEIGIEREMQGEHITTKEIAKKRVTEHEELHRQHADVGAQLRYRIHEHIPFGLVVYDESHVVVRAYDEETGSVRVMADTDSPAAIAWAEDVIAQYRGEADPPAAVEGLPDWTPDADIEF